MQMKCASLLAAGFVLAGSLAMMMTVPASAAPKEASTMPKVGDVAPDFSLHYFDGNNLKEVKLSDFRGKQNVVLAFYIFAFTGG